MVRFQAWAAGCLLLIGAGLALFSPRTAQSQGAQSVVVTNTTSQPIPVSKSGAWSVGINNIPTVKLDPTLNTVKLDATTNTVKSAQSGAWTVGLNTAANTVRIVNAKTSPVPNYNARDAMTPFQATLYNGQLFTVPTGKRLVIEYVGVNAWVYGGATFYSFSLTTTAGGVRSFHALGAQSAGIPSGTTFNSYSGGNATRIYADANTTVAFSAGTAGVVEGENSFATFSGYTVPYP